MENEVYEFRDQAVYGFLKYQAAKYALNDIEPIQKEFHYILFEKYCSIGDVELKEGSTYLCNAILPNFEVKNVLLEVKKMKNEWVVILKINFFGLSLCVNHTKDSYLYFVGEPNIFCPRFKIITKETNLTTKQRRDNLI